MTIQMMFLHKPFDTLYMNTVLAVHHVLAQWYHYNQPQPSPLHSFHLYNMHQINSCMQLITSAKEVMLLPVFTRESKMLRTSLPSSGHLSVCLSVTLVICIKMVQARITKSSLWAAPKSLFYRDKILCHWVQRFPSNEGVKEEYPPKKTSFCRYWLE